MKKKIKIKALILDFDGTMATPSTLDFDGINQTLSLNLRQKGLLWPEQGYLLERIRILYETLPRAWGEEKSNALLREIKAYIMSREMEAARESRLFSFTPKVLAQAQAMGLSLAIASRNCGPAILSVFPEARNYVLLSREKVTQIKPHPGHFREAARLMGVDIDACAAAGDHVMDMEAAAAAGCLGVGVLSGLSSAGELREGGADIIVAGLAQLLPILAEKGYLA
ncbi:MAG: HAD hydrolase-like protein [Desulfarculales bacterium]|jgi:phosphoglycolate phosphatase-like HAD superfamily hydrolase|nr:HAD hydrolase-like protein [Desulfarculales bacterium]